MAWTIDEMGAYIQDEYIPGGFIDQVYKGMPLLVRLESRGKIEFDGFANVRQSVVVAEMPGDAYTGLGNFDTGIHETDTFMQFPWRYYDSDITIAKTTLGLVSTKKAAGDFLKNKMKGAEMKLRKLIDVNIMGHNTWGTGIHIDGLQLALDDTTNAAAYGQVTRSTVTALKGNVNYTGGPTSLPMVGTMYDSCSVGNSAPDLAITTRVITRKLKNILQPQERYLKDSRHQDLISVGFDGVQFERMAIVADDYCPSGIMLLLNTEFVKLVCHSDYHFVLDKKDGWKQPLGQSALVNQILWWGNLVVQSPRLCGIITGTT